MFILIFHKNDKSVAISYVFIFPNDMSYLFFCGVRFNAYATSFIVIHINRHSSRKNHSTDISSLKRSSRSTHG